MCYLFINGIKKVILLNDVTQPMLILRCLLPNLSILANVTLQKNNDSILSRDLASIVGKNS